MNQEHHRRDNELTPEQIKQAFKEAQKEWLDEKFSDLGKWSMGAIAAALLVAIAWFILVTNGWHKVP